MPSDDFDACPECGHNWYKRDECPDCGVGL